MSHPENIATTEEILVHLNPAELSILLRDMVDYARNAIIDRSKEKARDLASDLILKFIGGKRKWNKELTFRQCLFGALQSDVFNYNRKRKGIYVKEPEEEDSVSLPEDDPLEKLSISGLKEIALKSLRTHKPPPDQMEEWVFECKMEGLTTPRDIADFLEVDVKEIYKAVKRLETKMSPVRKLFKSMGYE